MGVVRKRLDLWHLALQETSPVRDRSRRLDTQPEPQFLTGGQPACYTLDLPRSFGRYSRSAQDPRAVALERPCLIAVTVEKTELSLPSHIETVAAAAAAVAEFVSRSGVSDDAAFGIDMAVREAVTNAVVHGNRQDENKVVDITLKSSPDAVEISVHDQGPGFNPSDVPDPTAAENILKTSGRGIFFMRSFMDEVDWLIRPEGGTTVRMLKRR